MNNKDIKYRRELEDKTLCGDILIVKFKHNRPCKCEAVEPVKPGYTRLIVKDIEEDEEIISKSGNVWSRRIRRNHAKGSEFEIHVNQICRE